MYIKAIDGDVTRHADCAFVAVFVDHGNVVPRVALAHAACTRWPKPVAIADDVVDLRLAKHFIDDHAKFVVAIVKHRIAYRLASAHQPL